MPTPDSSLWKLSLAFIVIGIFVLGISGCASFPGVSPSGPDLAWSGPKIYSTGSAQIYVSGFGIDAPVDQLPRGTTAVTVTRQIINTGNAPVPAGYLINERVVLLRLVSTGTAIGFVPIPGPPVADLTVRGPALAPGATMPMTFNIPVPACGIYLETLTLDSGGTVAEIDEKDNEARHFFATPGSMAVNIAVAPPQHVNVWHEAAPVAPAGLTAFPAFPGTTHTFTITAATPGTTFHYNYRQAPVIGSQGSVSWLAGPAPMQPPAPPVAGPIAIRHLVTPRTHSDAPITDILTETVVEHFLPKVTAITSDGCSVRQSSAQVSVTHPGR